MDAQIDGHQLKRTPLFECHRAAGAKFVPFGGWEMPVQYRGVIEEHRRVRESAGLFDVSHMGEVFVRGPEARRYLQRVTCNDVEKLQSGKAQYSILLNPEGGAVDDIIVYQLGAEEYLLCVNASNETKDFEWLCAQNREGAELENASRRFGQIALQGPKALEIFQRVVSSAADFSAAGFSSFEIRPLECRAGGRRRSVLVARTGYTGEDGVEIFVEAGDAADLWAELLERGADLGLAPIGLGARDTLRLEACLPLYGHELRADIPVLCANLGWVVKFDKGDFVGKEALLEAKAAGLPWKLCGLEVRDPGIVREGVKVYDSAGAEAGFTTSGTKLPWIDKAAALAYLKPEHSAGGAELTAEVRGRRLKVAVTKTPFYRRVKK